MFPVTRASCFTHSTNIVEMTDRAVNLSCQALFSMGVVHRGSVSFRCRHRIPSFSTVIRPFVLLLRSSDHDVVGSLSSSPVVVVSLSLLQLKRPHCRSPFDIFIFAYDSQHKEVVSKAYKRSTRRAATRRGRSTPVADRCLKK